jgi:hypothetical protein
MGFIVLCDAINRAGSTEPEAIQKAMRAINTPASQLIFPWDGVKFGLTGKISWAKPTWFRSEGVNYSVWPWNFSKVFNLPNSEMVGKKIMAIGDVLDLLETHPSLLTPPSSPLF